MTTLMDATIAALRANDNRRSEIDWLRRTAKRLEDGETHFPGGTFSERIPARLRELADLKEDRDA